ncbi:MAG: siderophore-interacting protein [Acidihalobacter sp.]|uniref:siderophore-interacting protein n=1 Tax=Acidihalobacter sp. TaxID=1872108 RepID=UPI00307D2C54
MSRPASYRFTVLRKLAVTPHMLRVTLGGEGMTRFPADQASAYVKLLLHPGQGGDRPLLRTYTVRAQRADSIDIDFVVHGDEGGPASRWAMQAQAGDVIEISGPGPKKLADPTADWLLLVGDMTALPAISVNLEQLPDTARGRAVIEVPDVADVQPLQAPPEFAVQWVINPSPGTTDAALRDEVAALEWPPGPVSVWAACEFSSMRALRRHFREERGLDRKQLYISSYWKLGSDETSHKAIKREDAERDTA